jgi:hypothetical protein
LVLVGFANSASLPSFVQGVNIFAFSNNFYDPQELGQIKKLGANYIMLDWLIFTDSNTSNNVFADPIKTPSSDAITTFVQAAHNQDLSVMLKPILVCSNWSEPCLMTNVSPSNVSGWFTNYESYIISLAQLGESINVDAISVGLELQQLSSNYLDQWQSLIDNVRNEYNGLLTYCSIFWPIETQNVVFWSYLDFISMDTYLPLWNGTGDAPSLQEMKDIYTGYLQGVSEWKNSQPKNISDMPLILSEVGYPSRNDGLISPSSNPPASCPKDGPQSSNFTAQDAAWTAVLESTMSPLGKSLLCGISVFWYDNPSSQDYLGSNNNDTWACDWSPRGKPAECTIAKYWNGTASIADCGSSNNNPGNGHSKCCCKKKKNTTKCC